MPFLANPVEGGTSGIPYIALQIAVNVLINWIFLSLDYYSFTKRYT